MNIHSSRSRRIFKLKTSYLAVTAALLAGVCSAPAQAAITIVDGPAGGSAIDSITDGQLNTNLATGSDVISAGDNINDATNVQVTSEGASSLTFQSPNISLGGSYAVGGGLLLATGFFTGTQARGAGGKMRGRNEAPSLWKTEGVNRPRQ